MTNYELIRSISKEELAVLLTQMIYGANDYPNHIEDIYKWLDTEAECYDKNTNPKEGLERITNIYFKNDNIFEPKSVKINGIETDLIIVNKDFIITEFEKIKAEMDNKGWYNTHDKTQFIEVINKRIVELKGE